MVQKEKLPLQAVPRSKLTLGTINNRHLPDQLGRLQPSRPHEDQPRIGIGHVTTKPRRCHQGISVYITSKVSGELNQLVRNLRPVISRTTLDIARKGNLIFTGDSRLQRIHHRRRIQQNVVQIILVVLVHHIVHGHVEQVTRQMTQK